MLNWASFWGHLGRKFSHRPGNHATVGVIRWPPAADTAGYRLRRPKLTPVSLISMHRTQIARYVLAHPRLRKYVNLYINGVIMVAAFWTDI